MAHQAAGLVAVFFRVFQENFHGLNGHGTIAVDGYSRNLARFDQLLDHENKFLRAFNCERRNHDTAAALDRFANQCCERGARIVGRVLAITVGRFHHQNICGLALRGSGMDHFAGRNFPVTHAADVAGKEQMARLPIDF